MCFVRQPLACLDPLCHSITIYQLRVLHCGANPLAWRRFLEGKKVSAELRREFGKTLLQCHLIDLA